MPFDNKDYGIKILIMGDNLTGGKVKTGSVEGGIKQ
jgi:hypothetical protein